jgi:hypothetical protein
MKNGGGRVGPPPFCLCPCLSTAQEGGGKRGSGEEGKQGVRSQKWAEDDRKI